MGSSSHWSPAPFPATARPGRSVHGCLKGSFIVWISTKRKQNGYTETSLIMKHNSLYQLIVIHNFFCLWKWKYFIKLNKNHKLIKIINHSKTRKMAHVVMWTVHGNLQNQMSPHVTVMEIDIIKTNTSSYLHRFCHVVIMLHPEFQNIWHGTSIILDCKKYNSHKIFTLKWRDVWENFELRSCCVWIVYITIFSKSMISTVL